MAFKIEHRHCDLRQRPVTIAVRCGGEEADNEPRVLCLHEVPSKCRPCLCKLAIAGGVDPFETEKEKAAEPENA